MTITNEQAEAIENFMLAVSKLRELKVIKSDRFLGDLGEFLASSEFGLALAKSLRQRGHDTEGEHDRVQIKFHNSPTRTNIDFGSPEVYDRAIFVIGPDSLLHPGGTFSGSYCFYEFSASHVREKFSTGKKFSCGKQALGTPTRSLTLRSSGTAQKRAAP
ncbi:MAG: hypothetical protein IPN63_07180 [Gammaproteobacteria bacterium]|nr:hypothetical protein [Gammaproteobacteria bacterium]MBK9427165.1 hypothetical protein [Gammaproteobacteria bacterium]